MTGRRTYASIVTAAELDRRHAALEAAERDAVLFASLNHLPFAGRQPL